MKAIRLHNKQSTIFPILLETKDNMIVYFLANKVGWVIAYPGLYDGFRYEIGHYGDNWDMAKFKKFTGTLELSND